MGHPGMMPFHPVSFTLFPSQVLWLVYLLLISCVALHISYSIQMLCQLIFVPALHRVKAAKTTHTHMQAYMQAHPHI
jgi:hypothetical protein